MRKITLIIIITLISLVSSSTITLANESTGKCEITITSDHSFNKMAQATGPCKGFVEGYYVYQNGHRFNVDGVITTEVHNGETHTLFLPPTAGDYYDYQLKVNTVVKEKPQPKPEPKEEPKPEKKKPVTEKKPEVIKTEPAKKNNSSNNSEPNSNSQPKKEEKKLSNNTSTNKSNSTGSSSNSSEKSSSSSSSSGTDSSKSENVAQSSTIPLKDENETNSVSDSNSKEESKLKEDKEDKEKETDLEEDEKNSEEKEAEKEKIELEEDLETGNEGSNALLIIFSIISIVVLISIGLYFLHSPTKKKVHELIHKLSKKWIWEVQLMGEQGNVLYFQDSFQTSEVFNWI